MSDALYADGSLLWKYGAHEAHAVWTVSSCSARGSVPIQLLVQRCIVRALGATPGLVIAPAWIKQCSRLPARRIPSYDFGGQVQGAPNENVASWSTLGSLLQETRAQSDQRHRNARGLLPCSVVRHAQGSSRIQWRKGAIVDYIGRIVVQTNGVLEIRNHDGTKIMDRTTRAVESNPTRDCAPAGAAQGCIELRGMRQ